MAANNNWRRWLNILWEGTAETGPRPIPPTGSEVHQQMYAMPEAAHYQRAAARLQGQALIWAAILGVGLGALYTIMGVDNIALPSVLLALVLLTGLLWRYPSFAFFGAMALCCLFEVFSSKKPDAITDLVSLWNSGDMMFKTYAHFSPDVLPVNLFEMVMIYVGCLAFVRMAYGRNLSFFKGDFFYPILAYLAFVVIAEIHGLATGGDTLISLQEVRSQFYFFIGYSMAVNLISSRKQINNVYWVMAICIAIKGVLYTYRRYVTLAGLPVDPQGVGSHEEAFFFDLFTAMTVVFLFTKTHKNLRWFMLAMLPLVIIGNIATNRRAGTAAILIAAPALVAGCYAAYPRQRKLIIGLTATGAALAYPYYQVFKNSDMTIAQPARAVRSHYEPDARDLESNQYRDAENMNQYYTIKQYPFGYGYGKEFANVFGMTDIRKWYPWAYILPHNQILWVWMSTGTQGFFTFWIMISLILVRTLFFIRRRDSTDEDKATGLTAIAAVAMLLIFGLYDLQLSNYRDMLVAAMLVGLTAAPLKELALWDWRKGPDATPESAPAEMGLVRTGPVERSA